MTATKSVTFHVPPRNQGQSVTYSYAQTEDGHVIECREDRSDGETSYRISKALANDEGDYWNGGPRNKRWRAVTPKEIKRYGLN